jgi:hypothetical protein
MFAFGLRFDILLFDTLGCRPLEMVRPSELESPTPTMSR